MQGPDQDPSALLHSTVWKEQQSNQQKGAESTRPTMATVQQEGAGSTGLSTVTVQQEGVGSAQENTATVQQEGAGSTRLSTATVLDSSEVTLTIRLPKSQVA